MADQFSAKVQAVLAKLITEIGKLNASNTGLETHTPQDGDVFVASYPKSGTTLLQNMMYQLVVESGGAPPSNFTDISEVVPWAEDVESKPYNTTPRLFKTHMPANSFKDDSTTRFIYVFRNGLDLPGSLLDFVVEWMNPGIELTDEDRYVIFRLYLKVSFLQVKDEPGEKGGVGRWFQHVRGWTESRRDNVLVLNYETIIGDLVKAVRQVAEFMRLDVSEEVVLRVAGKCDRATMAADLRFRDNLFGKRMGWDPSRGDRVRMPGTDGFRGIAFTEEEREAYDTIFQNTFGVDSFDKLKSLCALYTDSIGEMKSHGVK